MAARDLSIVDPANKNKPDYHHDFYAEANVLFADLTEPLKEKIRPQALVKLSKDGQYQFRQADPFHLEGILSYKGGYTQVAGHPSTKSVGFATLTTSVVEGLNILDIVTADRVVAQISTVHPAYGTGQVPAVNFLGTRFDNLRIAGHRVEVERELELLGPRRDDDTSYFDDDKVLDRISQQYDRIATSQNLPDWARENYPKGRTAQKGQKELNCSVISSVKGSPGFSFGHVIDLPHFGKIFLGDLRVTRTPDPLKKTVDTYKFHLTMIRFEMGCTGAGTGGAGSAVSNGQGSDGGGSTNKG
jgi:hypothetical protein